MPLVPAITDLELLTKHFAVSQLLAWNRAAVLSAKFDRDELSVSIAPSHIRESCAILRDDSQAQFKFLSDITAVDWYPYEPRFEVVYHLVCTPRRYRVRFKVRLAGSEPSVEAITTVSPAAEFLILA